jgi:hypothetical protein
VNFRPRINYSVGIPFSNATEKAQSGDEKIKNKSVCFSMLSFKSFFDKDLKG